MKPSSVTSSAHIFASTPRRLHRKSESPQSLTILLSLLRLPVFPGPLPSLGLLLVRHELHVILAVRAALGKEATLPSRILEETGSDGQSLSFLERA